MLHAASQDCPTEAVHLARAAWRTPTRAAPLQLCPRLANFELQVIGCTLCQLDTAGNMQGLLVERKSSPAGQQHNGLSQLLRCRANHAGTRRPAGVLPEQVGAVQQGHVEASESRARCCCPHTPGPACLCLQGPSTTPHVRAQVRETYSMFHSARAHPINHA